MVTYEKGVKEADKGVKRGTTSCDSPLFDINCSILITNSLYNISLRKGLDVDFPGAILVCSHAFDDSFLAEAC